MPHSLKKPLTALLLAVIVVGCQTEAPVKDVPEENPRDTTVLFQQLKTLDSLLFSIGFNECNLAIFDSLVADDFEFYHDQSGITPTKEAFVNGIENGLCNMDYKATRRLVPSTPEVFPLYNNGELYGALQKGAHRFYAQYPGEEQARFTSEAKFNHLWLLQGEKWLLSRVISYDHVPFEE